MILRWVGGGLVSLYLVFLIVGNAARFYYWLRCWGKYEGVFQACKSQSCRYRKCCPKWAATITEEEKEKLWGMLQEMEQKQAQA